MREYDRVYTNNFYYEAQIAIKSIFATMNIS